MTCKGPQGGEVAPLLQVEEGEGCEGSQVCQASPCQNLTAPQGQALQLAQACTAHCSWLVQGQLLI